MQNQVKLHIKIRESICHKFRLSHRSDENNIPIVKKYGLKPLRRGRPESLFGPIRCRPAGGAGRLQKRTAVAGRPAVIFHHSLAEYNGFFYELRITNNEPQPFEGRSCALFPEFVTAKPHLSHKRQDSIYKLYFSQKVLLPIIMRHFLSVADIFSKVIIYF